MRKHIKHRSGEGEIYDEQGSFVAHCTYRLHLYERTTELITHDLGTQKMFQGFEMRGTITPEIQGDATLFWQINNISRPLVLYLSERQRLDFFFSDIKGTIESNGRIYEV